MNHSVLQAGFDMKTRLSTAAAGARLTEAGDQVQLQK